MQADHNSGMMQGHKTTSNYWNNIWKSSIRMRLPSRLNVATRNLQRILEAKVKPNMHILEIGCAPGKILVWAAKCLDAKVAGLDYSPQGIETARSLFQKLGVQGDLRCENIFHNSFAPQSFDLVFSAGVIEHFDDPREIIKCHVKLLKPSGKAIIAIPHYGGVYGRLQNWLDPDNLAIHNTQIMNTISLKELAPEDLVTEVFCYPTGHISPWILRFSSKLPSIVAKTASYTLNLVGSVQPFDIAPLCPLLVLEMKRRDE